MSIRLGIKKKDLPNQSIATFTETNRPSSCNTMSSSRAVQTRLVCLRGIINTFIIIISIITSTTYQSIHCRNFVSPSSQHRGPTDRPRQDVEEQRQKNVELIGPSSRSNFRRRTSRLKRAPTNASSAIVNSPKRRRTLTYARTASLHSSGVQTHQQVGTTTRAELATTSPRLANATLSGHAERRRLAACCCSHSVEPSPAACFQLNLNAAGARFAVMDLFAI